MRGAGLALHGAESTAGVTCGSASGVDGETCIRCEVRLRVRADRRDDFCSFAYVAVSVAVDEDDERAARLLCRTGGCESASVSVSSVGIDAADDDGADAVDVDGADDRDWRVDCAATGGDCETVIDARAVDSDDTGAGASTSLGGSGSGDRIDLRVDFTSSAVFRDNAMMFVMYQCCCSASGIASMTA